MLFLRSRLFYSANSVKRTLAITRHITPPAFLPCKLYSPRAMASSTSAPFREWLVILPDFPNAIEKRLSVRPDHLKGLGADPATFWLFGGATLDEPIKEGDSRPPKMNGSIMLIGANTREEVVERLKKDVYVKGEVWDFEKAQIIPFKTAIRKAL